MHNNLCYREKKMAIICKYCFAFDVIAAIEAREHLRNDVPQIK